MKSPVFKRILTFAVVLLSSIQLMFAQNISVKGVVTDAAGEPIIGASVIEKGTTNGVITGIDGDYTLSVKEGVTLSFSCVGFVTVEKTAVDGIINVTLEEDRQLLDDVVVVGYGVQKKSDVTGAIASIKSDDLANRSADNVASLLQGKAAGVQVMRTSGAPGSGSTIRIRGVSSNGSSDPLYIVDGLKVSSIDYLDANNIESMEILKDAASAAIYGAEAGNGVVLITTKTAKKGQSKITFNAQVGIQSQGKKADLLNAEQYVGFMTELGAIAQSSIDALYTNDPSNIVNGKLADTDWQDVMYKTGISQNYNLGFEGASDRGNVFISLGYNNHDGIVVGDKDTYERISLQTNASYKVTDWLKVGTTNTLDKAKIVNTVWPSSIIQCDPLTPVEYSNGVLPERVETAIGQGHSPSVNPETGLYFGSSAFNTSSTNCNPLELLNEVQSYSERVNVNGTVFADFTPFKNFVFTSRLGYRLGNTYSNSMTPRYWRNDNFYRDNITLSNSSSNSVFYQWENFANYSVKTGKNTFSAMAGMSYIKAKTNSISASTEQLTNNASNYWYLDYSSKSANDTVGGSIARSGQLSYFGRLGWNFSDKYNILLNFRADAYDSSKLDKDHRWGYFPSASAGWTISNEEFMKDFLNSINMTYLKLRASYGINGSISNLGGYQYASTMNNGRYYYMYDSLITGTYPSTYLANPSLHWEESKQLDLGLDMRFFSDRLLFSAGFYNKNTDGMLVSSTPNLTTGASSVYQNVGIVHNHGFEFETTWRDQVGDFHYSISGNLSTVNNRVKKYKGEGIRLSGSSEPGSTVLTVFEEGYPVWDVYSYKYLGVDSETGKAILEDVNSDGQITDADKQHLGSAIPKVTYGITINMSYKGFDFLAFGTGAAGNKLMLNTTRTDQLPVNRFAFEYEDRWTPSNTNASRPAPTMDTNYYYSSAFLFDASYFRIKQIQLGYTLPKNIVSRIGMSQLRIYASLDDFFTFTSYPGMDPEVGNNTTDRMALDTGAYPLCKSMVFGVNISF